MPCTLVQDKFLFGSLVDVGVQNGFRVNPDLVGVFLRFQGSWRLLGLGWLTILLYCLLRQ